MLLRTLLSGLCMCTAASAFAEDSNGNPSSISLDTLKEKCADIIANPQMVKPKVKITCNELSTYWAPLPTKGANLPNARNVGATVQMKGFQVAQEFFPQQVGPTQIACSQYQKIQRQIHNIDVDQTCEQLAGIKDLGAFCAPIVQQRVAQDPALAEEHPTNDVISLCPQRGE